MFSDIVKTLQKKTSLAGDENRMTTQNRKSKAKKKQKTFLNLKVLFIASISPGLTTYQTAELGTFVKAASHDLQFNNLRAKQKRDLTVSLFNSTLKK